MTKKPTLHVVPKSKPTTKAEKTFEDGPWGQKFMHAYDKKAAYEAAERADMTIPEWLALAIREKVAAEHERWPAAPAAPSKAIAMLDSEGTEGVRVLTPLLLTADEILRVVDVAEEIARRRGKALKPTAQLYTHAAKLLRAKVRC
jgi:hypothetical protein